MKIKSVRNLASGILLMFLAAASACKLLLDGCQLRFLLSALLAGYNDGRRKTLYCLATNLLPLDNLRQVMEHLALLPPDLLPKERASQAARLLLACARKNGVELKLRKKQKK